MDLPTLPLLSPPTPIPPSILAAVPTAIIGKDKKVPCAEYTKTSAQSTDILVKNSITSLSTDSTKRMATLTQVLRTEYL